MSAAGPMLFAAAHAVLNAINRVQYADANLKLSSPTTPQPVLITASPSAIIPAAIVSIYAWCSRYPLPFHQISDEVASRRGLQRSQRVDDARIISIHFLFGVGR